MATVTFISFDGEKHEVPFVEGQNLMQVAIDNGVSGIDGDCGGDAACGTCHVTVDQQWIAATGSRTPAEEQMLEMNPDCQETSRLSCQIALGAEHDGLIVNLPEFQF
ncbi:2Fe-2S iron-sulfur cluster-binding protein [Gordonia paraffinivorans]|uniref:2Fe-2S ferredoxin n=2 Tax=Gordonia paraffinivorans TaxID=175628 RepID=A0ABQ0IPT4_9ACTN|nr:2Fe-2S iron-sulfur cluster-binding protein [Gordonia paraffinivorans]MBY4574901.1 2Fe-2S ferredoxin [Gordonia paraffinivorans]MCD2144612.1 2Fe-2S iron-sulfur cluster-binding protein [Gordonia paraffinivorans]PWD41324.1 2Fe-2S ferredoxin [Gordonia paraffinivorans]VFA81601.1 Ferredoxin VI [Gordonia paraffinivorans]GAC85562.1 putative 2Fe-2S ferredoxin [Gordonia paraffinivorans NBRC 108238]